MIMSNDENTLRSVGAAVTGHYKVFAYRKRASWFYQLNDGLVDVGTFTSRETAIANARRNIKHYHRPASPARPSA
jgi:hypothetical protein